MNADAVAVQLAKLPAHERQYAQAQLARAEAILETVTLVATGVRKAWHWLADPIAEQAKAFTDRRTRTWPHVQAR
jgi:hypothetical protein